ncbi:MAG TPA: UvrB/UvrC motif-containing protein [Candidatus Paceibacterota bacterium]|nr:UvrB/UvrC motif-containing protein [Candidatus Paceibacterota bacterium]
MEIKVFKTYKIPDKPGVYFFRRGKETLYIGKATSLRSRVKSYFSRDLRATRGPLLVEMLTRATKIDWQETDSVLEALILEATLIKKFQPKYNTDGKSDKSWNYVCLTKEEIPQIILVRERQLSLGVRGPLTPKHVRGPLTRYPQGDKKLSGCYGPFTNGGQLREAMKIIRRIFPYLDASASKRANYMFYKQVGLAPDILSSEGKQAYLSNIKNIKLLFEGKKKTILRELEKQMKIAAKAQEFEKAGEIKRQWFSLKHINDVALLKNDYPILGEKIFRIEAYDIAHLGGKSTVGAMVVVESANGGSQVAKNHYRKFRVRGAGGVKVDDTGNLREVLARRLEHSEWPMPDLIAIDGGRAQYNTAVAVLKEKGLNIEVVSVVKDETHKARDFIGNPDTISKRKKEILLANSEAHRFGTAYHKNLRGRNFLNKK